MLAEDTIEIKVLDMLSPSIQSMGYEIVRIKLNGSGAARALQVMIDRADEKAITVDDCEKVSKHVSALLDVDDPIQEGYNLEVSSPGIDRPLTRLKDFIRFSGFDAKIDSRIKIEGQGKFRGKLVGCEGEEILLDLNVVDMANPSVPKRVKINFNNVRSAKLVLTDELMDFYAKD